MSDVLYVNQTIYPHKRREDWIAPDLETAQRWRDEIRARGGEAYVTTRWNVSAPTQFVTEVWIIVERPES